MEFKSVFAALVIFIVSAVTVDALRCYVCDGINTGACFDPEENNVTSVVCEDILGSSNEYVCYKIYGTVGNNEVVSRGCQIESQFDFFCSLNGVAGDIDCVSCKEDLCNSSNKIGLVSFTFLVLPLLVAKLL